MKRISNIPQNVLAHAVRFLLIALCGWFVAVEAAPTVVPKPPQVKARSFILQDFHSGRILAEQNADDRVEPASLTKIMTAYVIFSEIAQGKISQEDIVRVSEKAWRMPGSRMFIEVNTRVSVSDLLRGMIVQSGNDASVALAEHSAGSEDAFADLMNQYADKLGLTGSHFVNAEGLPHANHYTTARDMAVLTRALVRDFPKLYELFAEREFTYNKITQKNRNRLLYQDSTVDGVKTGYTKAAGYCLVTSAKREEMRLVAVVMGADGPKARVRQSQALLTFGFRFFETHKLYAARAKVTNLKVFKGVTDTLAAGLNQPLWITVGRGQYAKLKASMNLEPRLIAPIAKGARVGKVIVRLNGEEIAQRNLLALENLPEGGLVKRLTDHVRLWLAD